MFAHIYKYTTKYINYSVLQGGSNKKKCLYEQGLKKKKTDVQIKHQNWEQLGVGSRQAGLSVYKLLTIWDFHAQ